MLQAQGRQPHEEVRKFYASHYSSNIMKGSVMGPQSLDELERMVRSKFQAVGNADLRPAVFDGVRPAPVLKHCKAHVQRLSAATVLLSSSCPTRAELQHAVSPSCGLSMCFSESSTRRSIYCTQRHHLAARQSTA